MDPPQDCGGVWLDIVDCWICHACFVIKVEQQSLWNLWIVGSVMHVSSSSTNTIGPKVGGKLSWTERSACKGARKSFWTDGSTWKVARRVSWTERSACKVAGRVSWTERSACKVAGRSSWTGRSAWNIVRRSIWTVRAAWKIARRVAKAEMSARAGRHEALRAPKLRSLQRKFNIRYNWPPTSGGI